jgi:hypothetical protein
MQLQLAEIVAQARRAAMQMPSDIETMLHCWAEASLRHVNLGKLMEISVLFERVNLLKAARFANREIKPPDWFLDAHAAARSLPKPRSSRGIYRVYVVLLRGFPGARDGELGLYVGESHLQPEERLAQHLDGVNAARVVQRFGIAALPSFCPHLEKLSRSQSTRLEAELASRIREATATRGLATTGVQGGH